MCDMMGLLLILISGKRPDNGKKKFLSDNFPNPSCGGIFPLETLN